MVDLETLGTHPGCIVLSIGAVMFDATGVDTNTFYAEINQGSSERHGLRADMSTLNWWAVQGVEARDVLIRTHEGGYPLPEALLDFAVWLPMDTLVWGNGASFDNAILAQCYRAIGAEPPWKFGHDRCYRTLKSIGPYVPFERTGTFHNALDDAMSQAIHASTILKRMGTTPP
jgi:exodeoxyribonuclease VIII